MTVICILILILILFVLITSITFIFPKGISAFSILTNNYSCNGPLVRTYQSGNITGSYLGLNAPEKEELLRKFVEFGKKNN